MSPAPFRIELLQAGHARAGFACGVAALDRYFQTQVMQDARRRVTACFVALNPSSAVCGFYTLAASSVLLSDLPAVNAKKLPRYPSVPVVRMGRLAVATVCKGQGLGGALLADALARCTAAEIAAHALVVDGKDQDAAHFYLHHGFLALPSTPQGYFLPLASVAGLV